MTFKIQISFIFNTFFLLSLCKINFTHFFECYVNSNLTAEDRAKCQINPLTSVFFMIRWWRQLYPILWICVYLLMVQLIRFLVAHSWIVYFKVYELSVRRWLSFLSFLIVVSHILILAVFNSQYACRGLILHIYFVLHHCICNNVYCLGIILFKLYLFFIRCAYQTSKPILQLFLFNSHLINHFRCINIWKFSNLLQLNVFLMSKLH